MQRIKMGFIIVFSLRTQYYCWKECIQRLRGGREAVERESSLNDKKLGMMPLSSRKFGNFEQVDLGAAMHVCYIKAEKKLQLNKVSFNCISHCIGNKAIYVVLSLHCGQSRLGQLSFKSR
jgi:hypothetical protein